MAELFEIEINNRIVKGFHDVKKSCDAWQVFQLINTKNNTTAELWVEKEFDYFEWQDWDKGFWDASEEYYQFSSGAYFTEVQGEDIMTYLQRTYEDLFPIFH
jgi:hypothetical protein